MAYGTIRTTGTLSGAAISSVNAAAVTASTAITVGDLIVTAIAQQTTLSSTGCTDNLGNSYVALITGTVNGSISGRAFYTRVTTAGTLGTVTFQAVSSANAFAACFVALEGPVDVSPVDQNVGPTVGDTTTPYGASTSTLTQPNETVIEWTANGLNAAWVVTGSGAVVVQVTRTNAHAAIIAQAVATTAAVTLAFSGSAPNNNILGATSFKITNLFAQGCF